MWTVSPSFEAALRSPVHIVKVRIEVLDTDLNPVEGGTIEPTNNIVDGSVDVDITRGNRRTFQMNLLNNDGQFSPDSTLSGLLYVDRAVRIWRGISYGTDAEEMIPVGTFLIDRADVVVERNMSVVNLAGQDFWKRLAKSQFTLPTTYDAGTPLNDVFRDMAEAAGVTSMLLDPLTDRPSNSKELNVARSYEVGDRRGEELVKLATAFGIDVFFDPLGRLVTEDFRDPADQATVWVYEPGELSLLTQLQASWDDEGLFNHIVVTGTGNELTTYRSERMDMDPASPTRISRIGDRVKRYESGVLASQEAVDQAALTLFYNNLALTENIRIEAVCNPAFEGNDIVQVIESDYANLDQRYRLTAFNIPLSTSKQTLHMTRTILLSEASKVVAGNAAAGAASVALSIRSAVASGTGTVAGNATANLLTVAISPKAASASVSTPITAYARDDWERSVSGGWGNLDLGGSWTVSWAPDASVSGGKGRLALPNIGSSVRCQANSVSYADLNVRTLVAISANPNGSTWAEIQFRRSGANGYGARLTFVGDNSSLLIGFYYNGTLLGSEVSPGFTYSAGTPLNMRAYVLGTSLKAKVWAQGDDEPVDWNVEVTDSTLTAAGPFALFGQTSVAGTKSIVFDELRVDDDFAASSSDRAASTSLQTIDITVYSVSASGGGAVGELALGGDHSLRGRKTFTFQNANQFVNNGDSQATIESKINACPVGGVVRIGAGNYSGFSISKAVVIECDPNAVTGAITSKASGWTWRGGQPACFRQWRGDSGGDNILIEHVQRYGLTTEFFILEKGNNWTIQNFDVSISSSNEFGELWADNANNLSISNFTLKDGIFTRTGGAGSSVIIGRGGEGSLTGRIKFFKATNCYFDGGSSSQGWFGVEIFRGEDARIEYCDLRGGQITLSIVRSQRTTVYKTRGTLGSGGAWGFYEHAGTESTSASITYCEFAGSGANVVYHNSGSTGLVFRQNTIVNDPAKGAIEYAGGSPNTGGGSIIEDNCIPTAGKITYGSPVPANISVTRNGPGEGPCA